MEYKDVTILITYYNTNYEIFNETILSLKKIQNKNQTSPIIIVDDGSDDKYRENIYKILKDNNITNVKVYHLKENKNLTHAVWYGLSNVETKYTMRLDSDDIIYYVPVCVDDVDVILKYKTAETHEKWKNNEGNSHLPGIVMRTDLYEKMYDNYEYFKKYERNIHEDTYHFQRFLLQNKDYSWCRTKNVHYIYRAKIGIMSKEKNKSTKEINRDIIILLKKENLY